MSVALLVLVALFSSVRLLWIQDVFADDNCWLRVIRETDGLTGFLAHSFGPLHREGPGTIFYVLLSQEGHWWFYPLWHGLTLLLEVGSPLLLYASLKRVWPEQETLATLAGLCLIALHWDHTLPYVSGINYRLGLFLTLFSFWLMLRRTEGAYWVGVGTAAVAMFGCTETALAMEVPRVLLLRYLGLSWLRSVPFLMVGASLVAYKFLVPPEGMYAGAYHLPETWYALLKVPLSLPYFEARDLVAALTLQPSLGTALCAATATLLVGSFPWPTPGPFAHRPLLLFGGLCVLSVSALLLVANREFGGNINSSHAALLSIGTALMGAALLHWTLQRDGAFVLVLVLMAGVLVNNLYLDLFLDSSKRQAAFWQAFEAKYPTLPTPPTFFFDVQDGAYFSDLRTYCDFESHLRKHYGVPAIADAQEQAVNDLKAGKLIRQAPYQIETHLGLETLNPKTTTVVRYREGKFQ